MSLPSAFVAVRRMSQLVSPSLLNTSTGFCVVGSPAKFSHSPPSTRRSHNHSVGSLVDSSVNVTFTLPIAIMVSSALNSATGGLESGVRNRDTPIGVLDPAGFLVEAADEDEFEIPA